MWATISSPFREALGGDTGKSAGGIAAEQAKQSCRGQGLESGNRNLVSACPEKRDVVIIPKNGVPGTRYH